VSRSILETLAILPSGRAGPMLSLDELGPYLAHTYDTEEAKDRERRHILREQLYRDGGVPYMEQLIDQLFTDPTVRLLRKKFVRMARFTNPIRRVVNELSTVYSEPARREVDGDSNTNYHDVLEAIRMDERALEISRLLNLHRALLVGFRVRINTNDEREPVLDIATPANVRAIMHPNDDTLVIGWMIRTCYRTVRRTNVPAWTLWTDYESVQLRENLTAIAETYSVHGLGVCPWVPVTLGPPGPGFWPGHEGEDLVAAHLAIWLSNVFLLKETKSATKQTIIQGEAALLARNQAADTEVPGELADGQSATTVDMSMDLTLFRDTADHVLRHAGLNYGIPPSVLMHEGVQSAEARELQRLPIRELRRQQQIPLRRFEQRYVRVMAAVLAIDLPALAFDASTWRIAFSESETPLDPMAEQQLFEARRGAGLDNTIAFVQRLHPGMTKEQAWSWIRENIIVETQRNVEMRPLQSISGSLGASTQDFASNPLRAAMVTATTPAPTPAPSPGAGNAAPKPAAAVVTPAPKPGAPSQ
jgi:hypothetical protein